MKAKRKLLLYMPSKCNLLLKNICGEIPDPLSLSGKDASMCSDLPFCNWLEKYFLDKCGLFFQSEYHSHELLFPKKTTKNKKKEEKNNL